VEVRAANREPGGRQGVSNSVRPDRIGLNNALLENGHAVRFDASA